MYTMDDFERDLRLDAMRVKSMERKALLADKMGMATMAAKSEHPVVGYVKGLPAESPMYPAMMYLKVEDRTRRSVQPDDGVVTVSEKDLDSERMIQENAGRIMGSATGGPREYIEWSLPAQDKDRPKDKGCGYIHANGQGIVYTACPGDYEHYIKAKKFHCWSLRCPTCMNDTALKKSVTVERQLTVYSQLVKKKGGDSGNIGHWVVSPPQELAKRMMQTKKEFDSLYKYVSDSLAAHGATAGVTIFHPWRQKEDHWQLAPHFHSLLYGFIDTRAFRRENPGWIIKKVHPREKIRSIRQSVAYLMTHMGLGLAEVDPGSVDWDLKLLDYLIPGLRSPGATYTEKDIEDGCDGIGKTVGDLSRIDWLEWTMEELSSEIRFRYWGGVARNQIRRVGNYRQYKIRVCKECGEILRTYDGNNDSIGSVVRYIADFPVMAFAKDAERFRTIYLQFKERLREEDMTIADFARVSPVAVCTIELGLYESNDIVLDGPFDEPDSYYINRQKKAYGASE